MQGVSEGCTGAVDCAQLIAAATHISIKRHTFQQLCNICSPATQTTPHLNSSQAIHTCIARHVDIQCRRHGGHAAHPGAG